MITYKVGGTQPLKLGEAVEGDGKPMIFPTHSGTGKDMSVANKLTMYRRSLWWDIH